MQHLGYVYSEAAIERFLETSPMVCEAGELASGKGKEFFLFDIEQKLTGSVRPPHHQLIGDCVSHGFTGAAEDLQFVQMVNAPALDFKWLSSEFIYGAARVQVGRGACGYGDGAVVSWAFEAGQKIGMVARDKYPSVDLTNYNASLAKKWGTPGVGAPQDLVEAAKSHLVLKCQLLQGSSLYEQARDVIYNGGAIVTGSNQLFAARLDAQGFYRPQGHGGHCTYFRGFVDDPKRPGIGYQNSWGSNPSVTPPGQTITLPSGRQLVMPAGFGFVDAEVFDSMHRGGGNEVWALWAEACWLTPDDQVKFQFIAPAAALGLAEGRGSTSPTRGDPRSEGNREAWTLKRGCLGVGYRPIRPKPPGPLPRCRFFPHDATWYGRRGVFMLAVL